MTRFALMLLSLGLVCAATACAHKKEAAGPTTAAAVPAPSRARSVAHKPGPMAVMEDSSKSSKEDDAIYFDFDSAVLREDARPVLQKVADSARGKAAALEIDGNCDEVGTTEYNLALGDERARAAKDYLVHMGVAPNRIRTVSYGSQRPRDPGHDESAHAKNRRDDLIIK